MNQTRISLLLVMGAFLAGSFVAVLDPVTVNWTWMGIILAIGVVGLAGFRRAMHGAASASHRLEGDMATLALCLANIAGNLAELNARESALPAYEARFEIDRLFRDDLDNFAEARETMIHVLGMRHYADVMSAFAAGERYINRVWSASTDGYEDEVNKYLERALDQFREAESLFKRLQAEAQSAIQ